MRSNNYKYISLLRVIGCLAVLLYHLNILKGGFLAVSAFLVLNGYFTCKSSTKEDFSLIDYYKKKFVRLYIPLLITVFLTISIIPLINNIHWFNLKPETTSVLFGYNNYWQIISNQDYFARSKVSPFIHLWYISLLMQLELIFPFIINKINKIKNKKIILFIFILLSIISTIYFYTSNSNITYIYYSPLTRAFSYIYGVTLYIIHTYFKKIKFNNKYIFYLYLTILITMFFITESNNFKLELILASLITCRLLDYGTEVIGQNKIISFIDNITYEIYLVQYPIIFIFEYIQINMIYKVALIILLTLIISIIVKKIEHTKIVLIFLMLYGFSVYFSSIDYTDEMNSLKEQLKQNEIMMEQNNKDYLENLIKEQEKLEQSLKSYDITEEELKEKIKSMPLVGIGDSVMLGAAWNIKNMFPNSYIDAKVSRSIWKAEEVLQNLKSQNLLGNPIVIHLGTNGDCSKAFKNQIMDDLKNKKVFWINTNNLLYVNNELKELEQEYDNLEIIDWYNYSLNHNEYFYIDGIHLNPVGRKAYTEMIYNAIYNNYLKEIKLKKEELIKEHEEKQNNKITFYGNDMLLNAYEKLLDNYNNSNFIINEFTYQTLLNNLKNNKNLSKKIILIFDKTFEITENEYNELLKLYPDKEIYFITLKPIKNAYYIDEANYLMPDGIHLNEEGNNKIIELLKEIIK